MFSHIHVIRSLPITYCISTHFFPQINRIHFVMCFVECVHMQLFDFNRKVKINKERRREREKTNTINKVNRKRKMRIESKLNFISSFLHSSFFQKSDVLNLVFSFLEIYQDRFLLFPSIVRKCSNTHMSASKI